MTADETREVIVTLMWALVGTYVAAHVAARLIGTIWTVMVG